MSREYVVSPLADFEAARFLFRGPPMKTFQNGDWIYNKNAQHQVLQVYRVDNAKGVYWSSFGTSINIKDARRLPASPQKMAKLWKAAVAFTKAWSRQNLRTVTKRKRK